MIEKKLDKSKLTEGLKGINRREFIGFGLRTVALLSIGSITGYLISKSTDDHLVWQIDPLKCTQCGRCATDCIKNPSAVKCIHVYKMCGYCNLCGGYFRPQVKNLNTGAENQLCPTKALKRTYIENPYYKFDIDEPLCIGCAKCVKGCGSFGNGSLHLQIRHNLCDNCNECAIARVCPSGAISRIPANQAYLLKDGWKK